MGRLCNLRPEFKSSFIGWTALDKSLNLSETYFLHVEMEVKTVSTLKGSMGLTQCKILNSARCLLSLQPRGWPTPNYTQFHPWLQHIFPILISPWPRLACFSEYYFLAHCIYSKEALSVVSEQDGGKASANTNANVNNKDDDASDDRNDGQTNIEFCLYTIQHTVNT